jgi:hypothetical protein
VNGEKLPIERMWLKIQFGKVLSKACAALNGGYYMQKTSNDLSVDDSRTHRKRTIAFSLVSALPSIAASDIAKVEGTGAVEAIQVASKSPTPIGAYAMDERCPDLALLSGSHVSKAALVKDRPGKRWKNTMTVPSSCCHYKWVFKMHLAGRLSPMTLYQAKHSGKTRRE